MRVSNVNVWITYRKTVIPTKNEIPQRDSKVIGAAILDIWIQTESSNSPYVLSMYRSERTDINLADGKAECLADSNGLRIYAECRAETITAKIDRMDRVNEGKNSEPMSVRKVSLMNQNYATSISVP